MNSKLFQPPVRTDATLPLTMNLPAGARRLRRFNSRWLEAFERRSGVNAALRFRASQRGVALVVTLILLVVITTLAVAFLALSHRETIAVSGSGSTLVTEYAVDAALERAKAQSLAQITARNTLLVAPFVTNNDTMGPDLMVSVCVDNIRTNSAGMFINPSPPVFIWTNKAVNNISARDDRFYLDLNRNNYADETGYVPVTTDVFDPATGRYAFLRDGNGNIVTNWVIGDPQWIGLLRDPTQPHGPNNPFIARYAFIILPAGRSLDINWIHNDTKNVNLGAGFTGYFRNQGVGSYELNLAAFLADVNPNLWLPYKYASDPNTIFASTGPGFVDALEILTNRYYEGKKLTLPFTTDLFASSNGMNNFGSDKIDAYADGPLARFGRSLETAALVDDEDPRNDIPSKRRWPGGNGVRHYFTIHDLWDAAHLPDFESRLRAASGRGNSEDRYTYYRILAQLGTDSVAEKDDRLNINYQNIDATGTNVVKGGVTNFVPWKATNFFHAAVDRLLTNEFFPYVTNIGFNRAQRRLGIPVTWKGSPFLNGDPKALPIYSPRVHQLLQMALNIFEATQEDETPPDWPRRPTVLRPLFSWEQNIMTGGKDIFITNYVEETDNTSLVTDLLPPNGRMRWLELDLAPQSLGRDDIFYDIPILFGARKGIPNFNEFTMNTVAQFSRKVQVQYDPTLTRIVATNQMLIMSISNSFIAEFWNSYSNAYPRPLRYFVGVDTTSMLTTNNALVRSNHAILSDYPPPGTNWSSWSNAYRLTKVITNTALVPSIFYYKPPNAPFKPFDQTINANNVFELVGAASTIRWGLSVSNRVLCLLFEPISQRLIDCYASARMNSYLDLSQELDNAAGAGGSVFAQMWHPVRGIDNQITTSRGPVPNGDEWVDYSALAGFSTIQAQTAGFDAFISGRSVTQQVMQAGYSPNIRILQVSSWEANDPLVHYTVYDLFGGASSNSAITRLNPRVPYDIYNNDLSSVVSSPGKPLGNHRYDPWAGPQPDPSNPDPSKFYFAEKDPGVYVPGIWDFPSQRFPSLGWLGRVHRGTPWQTIYLKAPDPNYKMADWAAHTGAAFMTNTFPTNDWRLLDIFTAAIHPNATRGRLSINQTNPAAWSAVFASVPVTEARPSPGGDAVFPLAVETVVEPMSVTNLLAAIVEDINLTRANVFNGQFKKLSDFMMVPKLTIGSPYIVDNFNQSVQFSLMDSDYERLPQQILSLVKLGEPRYVVYSWGQSLKPADYVPGIGIGVDAGTKLTRNYQITGELATRAVVRVEFERNPVTGQSLFNRPHAVVENFNILPNE